MPVYQASVIFIRELMHNPLWVSTWLNTLMLVNLASAFFWPLAVAQLIFYTLLARAALLLLNYLNVGPKGLLKLGPVLWWLLVPYLVLLVIMSEPSLAGPFKLYVSVLIICNSLSLVFELGHTRTVLVRAN